MSLRFAKLNKARKLEGSWKGRAYFVVPDKQKRALAAVAAASKAFDRKYGTNVFQAFLDEVFEGHFKKAWRQ